VHIEAAVGQHLGVTRGVEQPNCKWKSILAKCISAYLTF